MSHSESNTHANVWGPGCWFVLHLNSFQARDISSQTEFVRFLRNLIQHLPCEHCRGHATRYLLDNPPERFIGRQDSQGDSMPLLEYTWRFHNAVNQRLGKSQLPYAVVKQSYIDDKPCHEMCSSDIPVYEPEPVQKSATPRTGFAPVPEYQTLEDIFRSTWGRSFHR